MLIANGFVGLFFAGVLANEDHVVLGAVAPLLLLEERRALDGEGRGVTYLDIRGCSAAAVADVAGGNGTVAIFDHLAADDIASGTIPFARGGCSQLCNGGFREQNRQGFDIGELKRIHQLRNKICRGIHSLRSRTQKCQSAQKV